MYRTKTNHNNTTHYARLNVPSKPPRDRGGVGGAARPPPRTVRCAPPCAATGEHVSTTETATQYSAHASTRREPNDTPHRATPHTSAHTCTPGAGHRWAGRRGGGNQAQAGEGGGTESGHGTSWSPSKTREKMCEDPWCSKCDDFDYSLDYSKAVQRR